MRNVAMGLMGGLSTLCIVLHWLGRYWSDEQDE